MPVRTRPSQEKPYVKLYGIIQCPCGGWHHITSFWIGNDECHTSPIECEGIRKHGALEGQRCGRKLMCESCKSEYCNVLSLTMTKSDPTQTEYRQL